MHRQRAFTLFEIVIAVFIMLLLLGLAVPSMNGVLADRRLRRSFDGVNKIVREAQERSLAERRVYLMEWDKDEVVLRPETLAKNEDATPTATFPLGKGEALELKLPAALTSDAPAQWTFWPSGTCEPAVLHFQGKEGTWSASYSPLTALPRITSYGTK